MASDRASGRTLSVGCTLRGGLRLLDALHLLRYNEPRTVQGGLLKRISAAFFRSGTGSEPVREWLRSLSTEDRRTLGYDIGVVEFGWPIGMPVCRSLGDGLWEVRT